MKTNRRLIHEQRNSLSRYNDVKGRKTTPNSTLISSTLQFMDETGREGSESA